MRRIIQSAVLLAACSLGTATVFAQPARGSREKSTTKDETVIIKKEAGNGKTVIEIKNGSVYVNGEAVVTVHDADAADVQKKIIIEGDDYEHGPHMRGFRFKEGEDDGADAPAAPGPRKAMLGVLTDPKSDQPGAYIRDVTPGSAAEKAGLQRGDVITRVDGKAIKDAGALVAEIMAQHEPGDRVSIDYKRNGKEHSTAARLMPAPQPRTAMRSFRFNPDDMTGDLPNPLMNGFPFAAGDGIAAAPKLGVRAEDRADGDGVRVLRVTPGSLAAAAGIQTDDVITNIGSNPVGSVDELQTALRGVQGGDNLVLGYQRNGKAGTLKIALPKAMKQKDL